MRNGVKLISAIMTVTAVVLELVTSVEAHSERERRKEGLDAAYPHL